MSDQENCFGFENIEAFLASVRRSVEAYNAASAELQASAHPAVSAADDTFTEPLDSRGDSETIADAPSEIQGAEEKEDSAADPAPEAISAEAAFPESAFGETDSSLDSVADALNESAEQTAASDILPESQDDGAKGQESPDGEAGGAVGPSPENAVFASENDSADTADETIVDSAASAAVDSAIATDSEQDEVISDNPYNALDGAEPVETAEETVSVRRGYVLRDPTAEFAPVSDQEDLIVTAPPAQAAPSAADLPTIVEDDSEEQPSEEAPVSEADAAEEPEPEPELSAREIDVEALQIATETRAERKKQPYAAIFDRERVPAFRNRGDTPVLKGYFSRSFGLARVRGVVCVIFAILLLFWENADLFGIDLAYAMRRFAYPDQIVALFDLQLLLFSAFLFYRELREGFIALYHLQISAEAILSFSTSVSVLWMLYSVFRNTLPGHYMSLCTVALLITYQVLDYILQISYYRSFSLLSAPGDKLAAEIVSLSSVVSDADESEKKAGVVRILKVNFVDGFERRSNVAADRVTLPLPCFAVALGLSLAAAVAAAIVYASFDAFFGALLLGLLCSVPLVYMTVGVFSLYFVGRQTADHATTVIDVASVRDYAAAEYIAFEDVEAFSATNVKINRVKLYDRCRLDHILYDVSSLFSLVGGPLFGVFRISSADLGVSHAAALRETCENGICAMVDNGEIRVGNETYMKENGIMLPDETEEPDASPAVRIMYAAKDGRLCAKFYIQYALSRDFVRYAELLHRRGMRVILRTFDPNITLDLIDGLSYITEYGVRVVHKKKSQVRDYAREHVDSGLVTAADSKQLLRALLHCGRADRLMRLGHRLCIVCAAAQLAALLFLVCAGELFGIHSLFLVILQLLWIAPMALIARLGV